MPTRFETLRAVYADAVARAPALAHRFAAARLRPDDLVDAAALARLPVMKKERLIEMQRAAPPFAGFLACDPAEIGHVFVSPGPIFEPRLADDATGHGMDRMFAAAGIGRGDLALVTWSYHLVPAGLLFDRGLGAVGATVIPAGTGSSELQADLLATLPVTVFLGSTAYFATLVERLEATGRALPRDWRLKHAFLGGEFGEWSAKRRAIEERFGLKTWSCYATADFGLIGYEEPGRDGYRIHPDRFVEICDPETGMPLPEGTPGEIVVTTLARGWPMIRLATGDVSAALETDPDGGVARIAPLSGRTGGAVKAREIFVYPGHVAALAARVPGIDRLALTVSRDGHRDTIEALLLPAAGADPARVEAELAAAFPAVTRLRLDRVVPAAGPDAFDGRPPLSDVR